MREKNVIFPTDASNIIMGYIDITHHISRLLDLLLRDLHLTLLNLRFHLLARLFREVVMQV